MQGWSKCKIDLELIIIIIYDLRYLDNYREYQRFDTTVEEVLIYCTATIPPSILMMPVSILCSLQFNRPIVDKYFTPHDSITLKLVKHIENIYF